MENESLSDVVKRVVLKRAEDLLGEGKIDIYQKKEIERYCENHFYDNVPKSSVLMSIRLFCKKYKEYTDVLIKVDTSKYI